MLHCLRYSAHSFPTILESIFYDATTISRVAVLNSSNKRCYGKNGTSRLAEDYSEAIRWHFHCGCPKTGTSRLAEESDFKSKISFGFLIKNQGSFFSFKILKNELI